MYDEKIEALIKAALADGVLTEKEKQVLFKRAQEAGIDLDEFEMVLDARLVELQKEEKEKAEKSAPKSTKYGDVRKCPVCGGLVPALAISCAECGYEFSGVGASSSAQELSKKIAEIKEAASKRKTRTRSINDAFLGNNIDLDADEQINSLVKSFPIPNSKNDLFDLILFLKNQELYEQKYKECINRAKLLYPKDAMFSQLIDQDKRDKKKKIIKKIVIAVIVICFYYFAFRFLNE